MFRTIMSIVFIISAISFVVADELIFIATTSWDDTKALFNESAMTIHYYSDTEIVATRHDTLAAHYTVIDTTPWEKGENYYFVNGKVSIPLLQKSLSVNDTVFSFPERTFVVTRSAKIDPPAKDAFIHITNIQARLPQNVDYSPYVQLAADSTVQALVDAVSQSRLASDIQTLQNFTTRNCYKTGGVNAQAWLKSAFETMGYTVTEQNFLISGQNVTDNVIATKVGVSFPDQYIIVGAHYDSYAGGSSEPGADDDASGVAGVLEMARILKDVIFEKTVVFCAFSGEEYGLYGSGAYAQSLVDAGKTVTAYLNLDMIGYRQTGQSLHADMIAPSSANALKSYFTSTAGLYVPGLSFDNGSISGGDSDHTSFNVRGFPGVWPFEDSTFYSPYIHTSGDVYGTSVNDIQQVQMFTQATLSVFTVLAGYQFDFPLNFTVTPQNGSIQLSWDALDDYDIFQIYRDGVQIAESTVLTYYDTDVTPATVYRYSVRAKNTGTDDYSSFSPVITIEYHMPSTNVLSVFPQPASAQTEIYAVMVKTGHLKITVYDLHGRLVRQLFTGTAEIGHHSFIWDFTDLNGQQLPSGIYYCKAETASGVITKKIIRLK